MRKKIKAIMRLINQENIELDEPAERFLSSLKTSTAKGYRGDLKKYLLFLKETNRDYNTLSEKKCRFHRNHPELLDSPNSYRLKDFIDI